MLIIHANYRCNRSPDQNQPKNIHNHDVTPICCYTLNYNTLFNKFQGDLK